jgi:hypothetical protein
MSRIQKVSSYFINLFDVLIAALPIWLVIQWIFVIGDDSPINLLSGFPNLYTHFSTGIERAEIIDINTVHWDGTSRFIGFLSLSFIMLRSIFRNYKKGQIFTSANAIYYKYLGYLFIINALLIQPLSRAIIVYAMTFTNGPGNRSISLTFGTDNIENIFCGLMIIVISWVMLEASKLHDEQKFTI